MPDPVPTEIIRARNRALHKLGQRLKRETLERQLGRSVPVLIEDRQQEGKKEWSGYTPNFLRVSVTDTDSRDLSNRILDVNLKDVAPDGDRLQGALIT